MVKAGRREEGGQGDWKRDFREKELDIWVFIHSFFHSLIHSITLSVGDDLSAVLGAV